MLLQAVHQMAEVTGDRVAQGCSLWQLSSTLCHQGHLQDAEVAPIETLAMLKGDLDELCNGVALSFIQGQASLQSAAAASCPAGQASRVTNLSEEVVTVLCAHCWACRAVLALLDGGPKIVNSGCQGLQ